MDSGAKSQRFVALFILGVLLFNFPILAIFNVKEIAFGIPVLYVYVFGAWAGLVALMALAAEGRP
jgi:hypothetical protein